MATKANPATTVQKAVAKAVKSAPKATPAKTAAAKAEGVKTEPKPVISYRDQTGTRTEPKTEYRRLRQELGWGRVALAERLGITTTKLWNLENHTEGEEFTKALAALKKVGPAPKKAKAPSKDDEISGDDLI